VDASRNIIDKSKHVNGKVDVTSPEACNACHGSKDNPAPPRDVAGRTDPSFIGVGAHQTHVREGSVARAFDCSECHVAPKSVNDLGHIDTDLPAEVAFGPLAKTGGAAPAWEHASATCQNTYCHGTFKGGSPAAPVWTKVGKGEAACGTCHALPPASPHPQVKLCSLCHNGIATDDPKIIGRNLHLNGKVDLVFPK
jgi:predicted CxxxxCH...CXXCH cytochrome family protein